MCWSGLASWCRWVCVDRRWGYEGAWPRPCSTGSRHHLEPAIISLHLGLHSSRACHCRTHGDRLHCAAEAQKDGPSPCAGHPRSAGRRRAEEAPGHRNAGAPGHRTAVAAALVRVRVRGRGRGRVRVARARARVRVRVRVSRASPNRAASQSPATAVPPG